MSAGIRKARPGDAGRIAEILVFNNRINYYPIFRDIRYSFETMNVLDAAKRLSEDGTFPENWFVYEDTAVMGFVCAVDREIRKLYVEPVFQGRGIGAALLGYAVEALNADHLWALEKNSRAIKFYEAHGFRPSGEKEYEEGTTETLIRLIR